MRLRTALLAGAATALLAACGTTENPDTDTGATAEPTDAAGPISITDARGVEVTLDAPVEEVVALEWSETEDLVTLGVMPVGVADVEGYGTWVTAAPLDDSVADVGTRQEPSVDAIVALDPDLVVMEDRGNNLAEQLEEYVPVIMIEGSSTADNIGRMRENFTTIATAVGKEVEAEAVLAELDAAIAEGQQAIADAGLAGRQFAMADGWMEGSTVAIRMFGAGSLVSDLAEELGLENAWTEPVDEVWGLGNTDVEGLTGLGELDFLYSASEEDVFADGLAGNAIWESLPFVENGDVHKLEAGTWTFGGPRSSIHIVEQFVAATIG
jgi:ABC-type Fe3+-hydroxamate transport system substrate-binding protein